jgi:hypothetical protein
MSDKVIQALLDRYGRTYAEDASIRLADRPAPLYQLLVLATLLSARINAGVAVAAARELFQAGYRTPAATREASWQDRVDALGRGHYRRYDERTATMLGDAAQLCLDRWRGDLREVQQVWTDVRPFLDRKVTAGAKKIHLPSSPDALAGLVAATEASRLASALVRVSLDRNAADRLREQVPDDR